MLQEATFAPTKPGPLKIIADVGDLDYYIRRAQELLELSFVALSDDAKYHRLNMSLSLLALAKAKLQENGDLSPSLQKF